MEWKRFYKRNRILILISLGFHLIASYFSIGYHHPDEHYQIFEFFTAKTLGKNAHLPWEYHEAMRSWLFPSLTYLSQKILNLEYFNLTTFWRFLCSLFGLYSFLYFLNSLKLRVKSERIALILFSLFFWFIPYMHARTSGENLGTSIFLLSVPTLLAIRNGKSPNKRSSLICGLIIATSLQMRYHIFFIFLPFLLWDFKNIRAYSKVLTSFLFSTFAFSILDIWGYGTLTFPPYNYFFNNIVMDRSSLFGVEPWYWYFNGSFQALYFPFALLIWTSLTWHWIKYFKNPLTAFTLPFILIHSLVAHKEVRFLIPAFPFVLVICAHFYQELLHLLRRYKLRRFIIPIEALTICYGLFLMIRSSTIAADEHILFVKKWNKFSETRLIHKIYSLEDTNPFMPIDLISLIIPINQPQVTKVNFEDFESFLSSQKESFYILTEGLNRKDKMKAHRGICQKALESHRRYPKIFSRENIELYQCLPN